MCEVEGVRVDRFRVAREVAWGTNLTLIGTTLSTGEEVTTGEDLVDEGVPVGRCVGVVGRGGA